MGIDGEIDMVLVWVMCFMDVVVSESNFNDLLVVFEVD